MGPRIAKHAALEALDADATALWESFNKRHRFDASGKRDVLRIRARRIVDSLENLSHVADHEIDLYATGNGIGSAAYFEAGFQFCSGLPDGASVYWFMRKSSKTMFLFHTQKKVAALVKLLRVLRGEYDNIFTMLSLEDDSPE